VSRVRKEILAAPAFMPAQGVAKGMAKGAPNMSEPVDKRPRNPRGDAFPVEGFALTVDGKIKSQYPDLADAMKVGLALKTKFPVIQVAIYDATAKTRTLVNLPEA
jgi:hypothetical protein